MTTFRNILIIRTDRIGDVVLTTPALRALRKACPEARISFWVSPGTRDLVDGLPFVDEVLVEKGKIAFLAFLKFVWLLRQRKFDLAIVYHTKRHVNMTCFLAGIPMRLGYSNNKFSFLLTHPVEDRRHLGEKHEAAYCLDLLSAIGVHDHNLMPEIAFQSSAEEWADRFIEDLPKDGRPLVAIHADASCPTRIWPAGHFARLIDRLSGELGVRPVLIGISAVKPIFDEIRRAIKAEVVDLTGRTTLAQMTSLFKRCALVISNDSGPAHVAAAAGAPVISLFLRAQPGLNPERWRPLGEKTMVLSNKSSETVVIDRHSRVLSGRFDSIHVEEVFNACRSILSSTLSNE